MGMLPHRHPHLAPWKGIALVSEGKSSQSHSRQLEYRVRSKAEELQEGRCWHLEAFAPLNPDMMWDWHSESSPHPYLSRKQEQSNSIPSPYLPNSNYWPSDACQALAWGLRLSHQPPGVEIGAESTSSCGPGCTLVHIYINKEWVQHIATCCCGLQFKTTTSERSQCLCPHCYCKNECHVYFSRVYVYLSPCCRYAFQNAAMVAAQKWPGKRVLKDLYHTFYPTLMGLTLGISKHLRTVLINERIRTNRNPWQ